MGEGGSKLEQTGEQAGANWGVSWSELGSELERAGANWGASWGELEQAGASRVNGTLY